MLETKRAHRERIRLRLAGILSLRATVMSIFLKRKKERVGEKLGWESIVG